MSLQDSPVPANLQKSSCNCKASVGESGVSRGDSGQEGSGYVRFGFETCSWTEEAEPEIWVDETVRSDYCLIRNYELRPSHCKLVPVGCFCYFFADFWTSISLFLSFPSWDLQSVRIKSTGRIRPYCTLDRTQAVQEETLMNGGGEAGVGVHAMCLNLQCVYSRDWEGAVQFFHILQQQIQF